MVSFLLCMYFDKTIVGLYNRVFNYSLPKKFIIPLVVGLRYVLFVKFRYIFLKVDSDWLIHLFWWSAGSCLSQFS